MVSAPYGVETGACMASGRHPVSTDGWNIIAFTGDDS